MAHLDDLMNVVFEVPDWISRGLKDGSLFRKGGVVWRKDGGIVAHLRESSGLSRVAADGGSPSSRLLASQMADLQFLSAASFGMQVLNLGISAVGFAIVISKLNKIQSQLEQIDRKIEDIHLEVKSVSRRQDLELVGKMKSALEIAEYAMHVSNEDDRRDGLNQAINELIKAANTAGMWLNELISTKNFSKSDLFDLYYRIWACSRIAIVQSHLSLEKSGLAMKSIQKMHEENNSFHERYFEVLQNFDGHLREHLGSIPPNREKLKAVNQYIAETADRIKGYEAEIAYIQENNIPYREWVAVGESEEPKLILLLPKSDQFPD